MYSLTILCSHILIFTGFQICVPVEVVKASNKKVLIKQREYGSMYPHMQRATKLTDVPVVLYSISETPPSFSFV